MTLPTPPTSPARAGERSICGSQARELLYSGKVRSGRFGELSEGPEEVWLCRGCGALLRRAGFDEVRVSHVHRFDVSNAVLWLRDRRPTGLAKLSIPPVADEVFRSLLQAAGRADYLHCECTKGGGAGAGGGRAG